MYGIALIVLIFILCPYLNHHIMINHLERYQCNLELYTLIKEAKKAATGEAFIETIRVETSTKGGKSGRYIIPLLLTEFKAYRTEDQQNILNHLGFTVDDYMNLLDDKEITEDTDIILGVDNGKGKLYLDYGRDDIALKCLESTGHVKHYVKTDEADVLRVETTSGIAGHHYRLKDPPLNQHGDLIHWVAEATDGTKTFYTRPRLYVANFLDYSRMALDALRS
jgi:hypothetical protein